MVSIEGFNEKILASAVLPDYMTGIRSVPKILDGLLSKYGHNPEGSIPVCDGTVKLTESFGGEGMGDDYWIVVSFEPYNGAPAQYFRYNGWYSSYDGVCWDDATGFEVRPQPVARVEYVAINEEEESSW